MKSVMIEIDIIDENNIFDDIVFRRVAHSKEGKLMWDRLYRPMNTCFNGIRSVCEHVY
jgi:hypothetical protein